MRKSEIITTDNGFAIVTAKGTDAVSLDEVSAIVALNSTNSRPT